MNLYKSYNVEEYVCASIDLLGQQDALARWGDLDKASATERNEILHNSVGRVTRLGKDFVQFVEEISKPQLDAGRRSLLSDEGKIKFDAYASSLIGVQTFGDTVLIYAPLNREGRYQIKAVYGILLGLGFFFRHYMADGVPLRAGIDIALGCNIRPGEIYGPVLASAHNLEAKKAGHMRIAVGSGVPSFIEKLNSVGDSDGPFKLYRALGEQMENVLTVGHDGQLEIDYASSFMNTQLAMMPGLVEQANLDSVREFAASQIGNVNLCAKIQRRYQRVMDFIDR